MTNYYRYMVLDYIERSLDYLFYNCYVFSMTRADFDDFARAGVACHLMSFILLFVWISLISIASLIMPRKCVIAVGVILVLLHLFLYVEIHNRYEDYELRNAILKRYKPATTAKALLVVIVYALVSLSPSLIIIAIESVVS